MELKSFIDLKKSLGTASIKGVTLLITLLLVSQILIITPSYALTSTSITPISLGRHSVPEASGIVASRTYSNIYWMHSDWRGTSDDYAVYAVGDNGKTVKKFMVTGASHDNWEDIAIDENRNLWICDIGDNDRQRATYALYKIPEPNPYGSKTTASVAATYRFALPDGSRDMDSCFVWQGIPYVIHKGTGARMYKIPSLDTSKTVTAQLVATFNKDSYIGGADISKDGRRLVFLSDTNDNQWVIERSASSTNVKDFFTSPTHEWKLSFYNGAGGGIAFVNAKYDFVVSSESGGFWMVTQDMYDPSGPEPGVEGGTLSVTTTPVNGEVFVDGSSWGIAPVSKSIAAGSHLVSFGAVSGYTEPADIPVSVNEGNNTSVTGTYGSIIPLSNNPTYMLSFQGYDFNNKGEVSVLVNNQVVATLPTSYSPQNAQAYIDFSLNITNYVVNGANTLTFQQNMYSGGVRNVVISNSSAVIYSNSTYYSMRAGGSRPSVTYSFTTTVNTPPPPVNGTLSVTTTPVNGEVFVDSISWGSAPVSKSIAAGSHTVSFGTVSGYTTPASVTTSVTAELTTSVTGTYIPANPPPNGQYTLSFQGYDYDNKGEVTVLVNNQVVASLPTVESYQNNNVWKSFSLDISNYVVSGSNTITFQQNLYSSGVQAVQVTESSNMLLDDNTPHDLWTGGTSSVTYTFSTTPPPPDQGILSVTTTPVSGEVFVNGTSWGVAPVSKSVAAGTYTVSFGSVAGYTTPSSVTVSVTAGLTTPVEGTYIPVTPLSGTLSVTTTPVNGEVFVDSILWGSAPVSNSVATGAHKVSFGAVPGYTAPSSVTVSVTAEVTTSVTGTYISAPPGNLTGTYRLSFQGYDFNNKGEVSVLVNNQVVATLPTSYAPQNKLVYVDFSLNITSYVVNGSNTVTIRQNLYSGGVRNVVISNSTAVIYSNTTYYSMQAGGSRPSVTYKFTTTITAPPPPINGTLSVTTTPVNGEVFVDSISWGVAPVSKSIAAGSHTVSFGTVSGYNTPADDTVSVTAGLTTSVTGTYTEVSPPPSGQYTLSFQGYDYDSVAEVTVLVNNQFVMSLPESESSQNNNIFKSFTLDITTHIVSGTNTITFQQNLYSSGVQDVQVTAESTVLLSNSTYYDLWVGGTASITYTFMGEQISQLLQVSGNQIVDAYGSPVKMVGINYGHFKGAYGLDPRNYHQEAINIKNDGFNAVRLVVEWGNLETSANPSVFTYNETGINDVLNMIDELTGQGLYVIIKLHTDGEPRFRYVNLKNFLGDQYCNEDPDIGNAFNTRLGDNFYYQSRAANPTGPFAHFSAMWEKLSETTRNNDKVAGYDLLNEPWTCITKTASEAVPIRAGWVNRVNELISDLRSNGDNKIIFVEPAPMWSRFGDEYVGFTFTKQSDNNVVYSWHWYEGLASHSGAMTTCSGFPSMENLTRLWGNITLDVDISCKDTPVWLKQAQDAYPNVPFDIGEFGNIYTNSEGDEDQQWIQNSIILFKAKNVTGYFYWSSKTTGTWISDIQASLPWNNPTILTSYAREIPKAHKDSTISPITYDDTSSPVLWKGRDSTAIMTINQQPPLVTQPKTPTATR
ncbi:MAG: PEGA domain-containing protein [Thaumarchaeota archaeon]|nr:PEGA domain-containing protein [Nitrososphaerota archaeon]